MNSNVPFINKLIGNFYILFILCYISLIMGVWIKYYVKVPDVGFEVFLPMIIPLGYCLIISFMVFYKIDKIMIDDTLTPDETKQRLEHVNDFHEKNVKLNYFKLILVLCFSFLEGCFVPLFADITLEAITCKILFGFGASIYGIYAIFFISDANSKIKDSLYGSIVFAILGIFSLFLLFYFDIITSIVTAIPNNPNNFFILSLTIVLLGATLALLAFTYKMIFDEDEVEKKIIMRKNGEYFFISTIFAIFFLAGMFILSIYFKISDILSFDAINVLDPYIFGNLIIFVMLLLFILLFACYSIKYLIIGLKSSIDILPFNF